MGAVIGRLNIEEPAFSVLLKQHYASTSTGSFPYEVRQYGTRFAAETVNHNDRGFMTLAKYIGVFGTPQNTSPHESISMTAPVVKKSTTTTTTSTADAIPEQQPTAIAMTAPVVKQTRRHGGGDDDDTTSSTTCVMQFMLPAKFQSLDQIPQPTNDAVRIREIPATAGAVHQYSGSYSNQLAHKNVIQLAQQLRRDGLDDVTDDWALAEFVWYGYNPPMTLPPFRRVEVFLPLTPQQVTQLVQASTSSTSETTTAAEN